MVRNKSVKTDLFKQNQNFLNWQMSQAKIIDQIEKLIAEYRLKESGATPEQIKIDKKKAELAELESKVSSKNPDKDEEKKVKLREQIAKLEAPKPVKGKAKKVESDDEAEKPKTEVKKPKAKKVESDEDASEAEKPKPKTKKTDEPEVKKGKAAKAEPEDVRVTKLSGALLESFKTAMEANGLTVSAESKKAFTTYANAMSSDDYAKNTLEVHMNNFASKPTVLTVTELNKQNDDLEEVSPGIYRNTKNKKILTGPPELDDEEFDDTTVEGVEYVLGQTTKRVYRTNPDGPDTFVGYWGVAKFYDCDL